MIRVGLALGASWLGTVNYYRNLLHAIWDLPDRQIEPVLLLGTHVDPGVLAALPPVEVVRTSWLDPLTPGWVLRKGWQQVFASDPFMERFLRARSIDVLSHADFLGRGAALPAICWIGDFQHREFPQFFTRQERFYRDHDFRMQCRYATRIILSSFDAQRALAEFDPSSVEKSRVLQFVAQPRVGGEGTDMVTLAERYGLAGPYLHVPNQFWAHKNHRQILEALSILRRGGERVTVISTGATRDYRQPGFFGELMSQADALGVRDSFRTLGVIPYRDLVGIMENAIALINPSRAEGWSTSVEEAKSLGKRVILSDLPVHREQAPPDAIYVDPDDAAGLADAMCLVLSTFDAAAECERAAGARRDLPGRVRRFAETYQWIVVEADAAGRRRVAARRRSGPTGGERVVTPLKASMFRCPRCGKPLSALDESWSCTGCQWAAAITAGVPVLLPDASLADHDELGHDHSGKHKAAQAAHFDMAGEAAFETDRPHGTPRFYRFLLLEKFDRAVDPIRPDLGGAAALTVCGGSGMDAEFFARAGASVVSSDLSLGAAKRARARSEKRGLDVRSIVADVERLPLGDESIDLVAVHDGLHHLADPYAGLSEMARVARRWVVVTEPARASLTQVAVRLGLALETEEAGNRVARMEPREVAAYLEARGFRVLRAERYAMYYPHHPGRAFAFLSRPGIYPLARAVWRAGNAVLGRFGNKMVVVAERRQPDTIDA